MGILSFGFASFGIQSDVDVDSLDNRAILERVSGTIIQQYPDLTQELEGGGRRDRT